jgi:1-acyl-sn-glycerol-3-phosphate acyltransferase
MTRRRVGLPPGFNLAGALRHTFWRNVFHAQGGFRVVGSAPYEAMVIVANHSSHADTPALIAAFPAPYKPVVVAADDYWFAKPWKARALKLAIGAVPVRRVGGAGYASLVESAQHVLGSGSSLLVFPEGTRSTDGTLGIFHTGAVRIAREFDVPLLPVAVVGTRELLPKKGRLLPSPVEVRVGRALQPEELDDDMTPVVEQIRALLAKGPAEPSESRTWRTLRARMDEPVGMVGAAAWGFAEAISWPVTAEMYLAFVAVTQPRRVVRAAGWLSVGSVAGLLVTRTLTQHGHRPPAPLTSSRMRATANAHMAAGAKGIWRQALNLVPCKLYGQAAADAGIRSLPFAAHSLGARGTRSLAIGTAVAAVGSKTQPVLRRFFGPYLAGVAVAWSAAEALNLRRWTPHDR